MVSAVEENSGRLRGLEPEISTIVQSSQIFAQYK